MVEIAIEEGFSLLVAPQSRLASLVWSSRVELLKQAADAILKAKDRSSSFREWFDRTIDRSDLTANEDEDDLLFSYLQWCRLQGVSRDERQPHARFARSLTKIGLAPSRDSNGRVTRTGCRLIKPALAIDSICAEAHVRQFLSECAAEFAPESAARTKSSVLYDAYLGWVSSTAAKPMSNKRFVQALNLIGFTRRHSNGTFWQGIRLRDNLTNDLGNAR
ncbi:primase-like DNA-binding domain-containing protein [Novosphingobium sp. Gsoil 351]|uniref:primase-like DNA-binding domain-containing protein n=1 Tax=Novosphingobium sp. Gsoil 351 TaxID=2675225 RepID=UPI0018A82ED4|nr:primase-like DNA-binding domain-containing protein [Novosphingobium sp. Gsoil 351]